MKYAHNLLLGIACLVSGSAMAAVIPVTSNLDGSLAALSGNGTCELREAIAAADTNAPVDSCPTGSGPDVIDLTGLGGVITVDAAEGELLVTSDITFNGPGAASLSISGGNMTRIFNIEVNDPVHVNVIFNDLSLINAGDTVAPGIWGGAIRHHEDTPGIGTLQLNRMIFTGNVLSGVGNGGALNSNVNTTINDSVFTNNEAGAQAGALQLQNADFIINNSTISNNTARGVPNVASYGGGIFVIGSQPTTLTINNSTISGNSAPGGLGGGIGSQGVITDINNSTISGNSAISAGGIINTSFAADDPGFVNIRHSTIYNNSASSIVGGIVSFGVDATSVATVTLDHTIIGQSNGAVDCLTFGDLGTIDASVGFNIDDSADADAACIASGGPGNQNVPIIMPPLADNGGPTLTHEVTLGGPAYNTGNPAYIGPFTTDQRGLERVRNAVIDIGAVELQIGDLAPIPSLNRLGMLLAILLVLLSSGLYLHSRKVKE